MSIYPEIKAQIAKLENNAKEARVTEVASAKAQISKIMLTYGLTINDIGNSVKPKAVMFRQPFPAKYCNMATRETWTGRGRASRWLVGKNKDDFSLNSPRLPLLTWAGSRPCVYL